jgi:hypothetical protein
MRLPLLSLDAILLTREFREGKSDQLDESISTIWG